MYVLSNPFLGWGIHAFLFFEVEKQTETKGIFTSLWFLPIGISLKMDGYPSTCKSLLPKFLENLNFPNQKDKLYTCLFLLLNVKFRIYTIFIIHDKKQNFYSVGLKKQLLKSDVFINILIRGIFPPPVWRELENQYQYGLDSHNCLHMSQ